MLDSNDLESVKMSAKLKIRSASVEDLGHIVKKMIDGVLEDTEQAAKLHQAVFEEYYSKKMEEFREVKAKIDADRKLDEEKEKSEPKIRIHRSNFEVGDTEPKNIDDVNPEDCPPSSTSEKDDEEDDVPVTHVVRRAKYVRVSEDINVSDTHLGLGVRHKATDLVQNAKEAVTPSAKSNERIEPERNSPGDAEVVEWWRSSALNKVTSEDKIRSRKPIREISVQFKSKGEIAFENWKKVKTETYHRVFREEQERRRQDQAAEARQNEKRQAASEAYLSWKRRQRLRRTTPRIEEPQRISPREKRRVNSEAFRAWKRQKDAKLRDRRMYGQTAQPQLPKTGLHVAFDTWCNQLDSVLHQKYLRERRYLVNSFYCQPTYFGSAALCGR